MLQAQILQERYQLQKKLGQNAGRQTWLAVDLGAPVPIPVILKLLAFSPQMQWDDFKLFEREAQVLKNLNHLRIPQYRNSFSLDKQIGDGLYWLGLVQDYIPGSSLQHLLNQGKRFTEAQMRSYATEILNILIYLHELSPPVLHRDIKPSNLLVGEDEQIYLVDFGAVQNQTAAEGVTFTVVGTSGYTPLEQFWGRAVPASDLYALGATLIHLLTGIAPMELPQKHLRIQFSDQVSLSHHFRRWMEALTEPDLDQRFSTARQALLALQSSCEPKFSILNIPQPLGSRIQIEKSANHLVTKLPLRRSSLLGSIKFGVKLIWTASLVAFLLFQSATLFKILEFPAIALLLILSCGWLSIPVMKELVRVLASLHEELLTSFSSQHIYFDRDRFVIEKQLFGWSYLCQTGQIPDIKNVNKIPFKEINILVGLATYSFGEDLNESERKWLAQEIQNWLN